MADFDDLLTDRNEPLLNALAPIAGKVGLSSSDKVPVIGEVTPATLATAPIIGPFSPVAGRPFNVTIAGGEGVVATIERRFAGDATWYVKYPDDLRRSLPPTFSDSESEVGVDYRVVVSAIATGAVTVRLSQ